VDAGAENFATGGFPPRITIDLPVDYTGNRLPNTPQFKVSGSAEYTIELGRYGALIPRYDFAWTHDIFFDPSEGRGAPQGPNRAPLPDFAVGQAAYWIHNVRLAYRSPDERFELAGWVRNLTDEVYKTLAFDASKSAGLVGNLVGDPRTYGVSLSIAF
jgi:iron complex outermembrane receptor protein